MLLIINSKLFLTALLTRHFWTFSSKVSGQHNDTKKSFHFICVFFFKNLSLYYAHYQVYYNIIIKVAYNPAYNNISKFLT